MKLAILSRGPKSYSTRRFKEAALERNHQVRVLNTLRFAIDLQKSLPDLFYRQKVLSHYDAVLPRIGASITYYGTAVVRQFQEMDVFCANTAHGITNSRDKLLCFGKLESMRTMVPVRSRRRRRPVVREMASQPAGGV